MIAAALMVVAMVFPLSSGTGSAALQCNGVNDTNSLTKFLSGYCFAGTRTSGGHPTPVYSILLNISTQLELRKASHAAKLELLEATLVTLESYKRRCTVIAFTAATAPVFDAAAIDTESVVPPKLPDPLFKSPA